MIKVLGFILVLLSVGSRECFGIGLNLNWCTIFFSYLANGSSGIAPLLCFCLRLHDAHFNEGESHHFSILRVLMFELVVGFINNFKWRKITL